MAIDLKRNTFVLTWGTILVLAGGLFLFVLLKKSGEFNEAKDKLQNAEMTLNQLRKNDPYPSRENVISLQNNLEKLEAFYQELSGRLQEWQLEPMDVEPALFPLEQAFTRLNRLAKARSVAVENNSVYGFDAYVGSVPRREHVDRLTVQLQAVEIICELLFECQIEELLSVERDSLEDGDGSGSVGGRQDSDRLVTGARGRRVSPRGRRTTATRAGARDAAAADAGEETLADELFQVETVQIEFSAKADRLWCVLDQIAALDMVATVKNVTLTGPDADELERSLTAPKQQRGQQQGRADDLLLSPGPGAAPGTPPGSPRPTVRFEDMASREDRLVAGRDPVVAAIAVDIYRFKGESDDEVDAAGAEAPATAPASRGRR